jgi:hypothetical protein
LKGRKEVYKKKIALRVVLLTAVTCVCLSVAQGQSSRTWVSGTGDDVNPCSRTAPCKTFAGAISKTAEDGEISALDPAGFGTVTITKSITINGEGTLAGMTNAFTNGVIVNADTIDVVILRNLSMNGTGTALDGVRILQAKSVQVDHCWINGQASHGIEVAATSTVNLKVNDTLIQDCGLDGIHVSTTSGQVVMSVDNTRIQDCLSDGIEADDNVRGGIRNSVITHNTFAAIQTSGSNSQLNLDRVYVSYSTVGLQASAGSSVRVSDSVIAQNSTGINANGGTIDSFQGNSFMGNTTNGAFTTTTNKL